MLRVPREPQRCNSGLCTDSIYGNTHERMAEQLQTMGVSANFFASGA